jgi:hypothetical protein
MGGGRRRHGKPEVSTAATLVLAIEILERVRYSGTLSIISSKQLQTEYVLLPVSKVK